VTCQEFKELASAYALGALDVEERTAGEAHLGEPSHEGCEEALRAARETMAALAETLPPVPPDEAVWRSIEARTGAPAFAPRRRMTAPAWAAIAAAVLFALLFARERRVSEERRDAELLAEGVAKEAFAAREALALQVRSLETSSAEARAFLALLDDPTSRVLALAPVPGKNGRGAAVVNVATRRAVIVSSTLAPVPGKTYELWVIRGSAAPKPAGFLAGGPGGLWLGSVDPALLAAPPDALAVSLEPEGGSATPTEVLLVGKLAG
jgi:anti-sigma-K factor RskA